jgi:hypothetical protein
VDAIGPAVEKLLRVREELLAKNGCRTDTKTDTGKKKEKRTPVPKPATEKRVTMFMRRWREEKGGGISALALAAIFVEEKKLTIKPDSLLRECNRYGRSFD